MPGDDVMVSMRGAKAVSCNVSPPNLVRRGTFTVPFNVGLSMIAPTLRAKMIVASLNNRYDPHVLAGVPEGITGASGSMWM
eukprot:389514-Pleurochrysis_carterae.AAC.1